MSRKHQNNFRRVLRTVLAAVCCAVLATSYSCSSKKTAGAPSQAAPAKRNPMVQTLAATYTPWTSVYAPVNVRLERPASFSFSARATMVYGKYVHLSLRVLGMEAGVVYVDNDSAYIIDKLHKKAVAAPMTELTRRTSITLADIQGILLGQAVYPGEGILADDNKVQTLFSVTTRDNGSSILTPRRTPGNVTWYLDINDLPALTAVNVDVEDTRMVTASFSGHTATPAGNVAASVSLDAEAAKQTVNASLDWNLDKAEWNGSRQASLPDLSGYRRISYTDLAKGLKF